jgi:hypothetical protein
VPPEGSAARAAAEGEPEPPQGESEHRPRQGETEPLQGESEHHPRQGEPEPRQGEPEPSQGESDRLRILELLEQHKITAAEAGDLLAALGERDRGRDGRRRERNRWLAEELAPASDRARWFRVRVTDLSTGRMRTNVSVPIGMVGFGLGFARRFRNIPGVAHVDDLFEAVREGRRGVIFDVANEGGERVEIFID